MQKLVTDVTPAHTIASVLCGKVNLGICGQLNHKHMVTPHLMYCPGRALLWWLTRFLFWNGINSCLLGSCCVLLELLNAEEHTIRAGLSVEPVIPLWVPQIAAVVQESRDRCLRGELDFIKSVWYGLYYLPDLPQGESYEFKFTLQLEPDLFLLPIALLAAPRPSLTIGDG